MLIALVSIFSVSYSLGSTCVAIDGPANVREAPNGKILREIPKGSTLTLDPEKKGDWQRVHGYFEKGRIGCSITTDEAINEENQIQGWIHKKNLLNLSFSELLKWDRLGTLDAQTQGPKSKSHQTLTVKKNCECGIMVHSFHDYPSAHQKTMTAGTLLGKDCEVHDQVGSCRVLRGSGSETTVCPVSECALEILETPKLTQEKRLEAYQSAANLRKTELETKIPKEWIQTVQKKFPNWVPFISPKAKQNAVYEFTVLARPDWIKGPQKVFVFFKDLKSAEAQKPSFALETPAGIRFKDLPFDLKFKDGDEANPGLCLFKQNSQTFLLGCRFQDEVSQAIGRVSLDGKFTPSSAAETQAVLDAIPNSAGCCARVPFVFTEFE